MQVDPHNPPRWIYTYEVTHSTVGTVAVGDILIDRHRSLEYLWEFLDTSTGATSHISGVRRERVCSYCYALGRWPRQYGHGGEHGEGAPRLDSDRSALIGAD